MNISDVFLKKFSKFFQWKYGKETEVFNEFSAIRVCHCNRRIDGSVRWNSDVLPETRSKEFLFLETIHVCKKRFFRFGPFLKVPQQRTARWFTGVCPCEAESQRDSTSDHEISRWSALVKMRMLRMRPVLLPLELCQQLPWHGCSWESQQWDGHLGCDHPIWMCS